MNSLARYWFIGISVFSLTLISSLSYAQMISDDDDSYFPDLGKTDDQQEYKSTNGEKESIRIGILKVRPTSEAEKFIPDKLRVKIDNYLASASNEINSSPKEMVPYGKIMSNLSSRNKILYDKCWIDHECLAIALKPADLDLVIASKIRMVEISKTEDVASFADEATVKSKAHVVADYTLFIRIIDIKQSKVLKEILVNHTDKNRLPELGLQAYRNALVELAFIVDDPAMLVGSAREVTGFDASKIITKDNPVYIKNKELKVAAFTTLGLGVLTEATALGMGFLSKKAQKDAENSSSIDSVRANSDDSKKFALTANILYGVGGGFLVSSVVLFVLGYSDDGYGSGDGEFDIDKPVRPTGSVSVTNDGFYIQAQARF